MDRTDEGVKEKDPEIDGDVTEKAAVVDDGPSAEERRRDAYRLW